MTRCFMNKQTVMSHGSSTMFILSQKLYESRIASQDSGDCKSF